MNVVLPFTKRTTAAVTVFTCIFAAQKAQALTSNPTLLGALNTEYVQLFDVYKWLCHQDVPNQAARLDRAIARASVLINELYATVLEIVSTKQNHVRLSIIQTEVAAAVQVMVNLMSLQPVTSVFGRTGAVTARFGDYSFPQISGLLLQSQLSTPTPAWFNVKTYGATGNAQAVNDAVSSGTNVVTSATANFTQANVGKVCWGVAPGETTPIARVPFSTVTAVINATTIHISQTLDSGYSSIFFVWGTDDTAALIAAGLAAQAGGTGDGAGETAVGVGVVYVPTGGYIFTKQCFAPTVDSGFSLIGDGPRKTVFFPSVTFDFTTVSNNGGMLFDSRGVGNSDAQMEVGRFSINGSGYNFNPSGVGKSTIAALDCSIAVGGVHDIYIQNFGSTSGVGNQVGGISATPLQGIWHNVLALDILGTGIGINVNGASGTMMNCAGSNGYQGVVIANVNNGTSFQDAGEYLVVLGHLEDEGGAVVQFNILNSSSVTLVGGNFFGNTTSLPMHIDGTSDVTMLGSTVGPFYYRDNTGAIIIDSGGTLRVSGSRIHKNGTGTALINNGTLIDMGGNRIDNRSGSGASITSMAASALQFGNGSSGTAVTTTEQGTGTGPATPQTIVKYAPITLPEGSFWVPLVQ